MADDGILGLLGRMNDPQALYGGALSDPATRQAMAGRGLLAMAGSFADSAMPTRMPTPFGAVLGHAAGAAGASDDALMAARLQNAQAQLAGSTIGLQNTLGPAYLAQIKEAQRLAALAAGGGIPSAPAPGAATAPVAFDPKLSGAANINNLVMAAAPIALPSGYRVEMTSGDRPGATVAGTGGASQHATANAADFKIWGPDGKEIPNKGEDTTGLYGKLALRMRAIASPDIKPWLAWGGNFGTGGPGSPPDLMHFDLAGDRGHLGTLAQMERNLASNAPPGDGGAPSFGAPSTVRGSWFGNAPGWSDKNDRGMQANGQPVSAGPGIALPIPKDSPDFGKWYDVTAPNGQTLRLQQTDVGPGPGGKGRGLDVNAVAAGQFGYNPTSFPTDGAFRVAPAGGGGQAAASQVAGLLNMPNLTGQMNAPIPGIPGGVAPAAPSLAPPAAPPGATAAARPLSAGEALVAANQATRAAGGPPPLPPGLPQMADASGTVPLPSGPNLVPGGRAVPGLLEGGGAAPPGPPPQVAAGPPPGQPTPLVTAPTPQAPIPPIAQPQVPPTAAAPPMPGPPAGAPPPLNLPMPPPMPGGVGGMGPPIPPTPQQMIAQGIVGISALIGKPAPDFMQKLAGQPLEMQMEAYKAYVGEQAKQMTAQYQKQLDASAARYIAFETSQGNLPADLTKMTAEQGLKLRNDMLTQHGLVQDADGQHWHIDPTYLDAVARKAGATAGAQAAATNAANLGATYPMGGGPPAPPGTEPAKGTPSPYGMLPPLSEQNLPRSKTESDDAVPKWGARVDAWTAAIGPAQVAEQRMMTIADAFKSIQSGKWAEQKADIVTKLEAIGIRLDPSIIDNAAKVQVVLHENVLSTLPMLKAATRNPTQTEFTTTREVREGPNVEPAANLQMLAEDIAMMRQTQNLPAAFHASGWQNALQFESAYLGRNKLAPMVKDIKDEIGKLRGMEGWVPPGLPPGAKDTGKFHEGKPIYEYPGPDGKPIRGTLQ